MKKGDDFQKNKDLEYKILTDAENDADIKIGDVMMKIINDISKQQKPSLVLSSPPKCMT
jgi:hypothetical protein